MVAHACNPSIPKAEAGGFKVQSHPRLHSESLSQKHTKQNILAQREGRFGVFLNLFFFLNISYMLPLTNSLRADLPSKIVHNSLLLLKY
jgi:hypothetical protein